MYRIVSDGATSPTVSQPFSESPTIHSERGLRFPHFNVSGQLRAYGTDPTPVL
jgi:hypothetical protein